MKRSLAVHHLLVLRHQREQRLGSGRSPGMSARSTFIPIAFRCARTRLGSSCAEAQPRGQLERQRTADGHAFTMQQAVGIARGLFKGMAEGMAQVQKSALALFGLVAGHDAGLHLDRAGHRAEARRDVPVAQGRAFPSSQSKKSASPSSPYFTTSP
jgi:hypothetical protein